MGDTAAWTRAYRYFSRQRDGFDEAYHQRSNVGRTIGAIKRKLSEKLYSCNRCAQPNEFLCKLIAYNITVAIHSMHLSGFCGRNAGPMNSAT